MHKSALSVTSHHRIRGSRILFTWGICVLAMIASTAAPVFAQTTAFTYQGTIEDGGAPANGTYDFEFALFDDLSAGSQVGSTLSPSGVQVANGAFSVSLDFGPEFPGAERFLETRVRQSGAGDFTTLGPRHKLNSAPYAMKSLSSETAATADNALMLGGTAANEFVTTGDARLSDAREPLPGSNEYVRNTNSPQNANLYITGSGHISNLTTFHTTVSQSFTANGPITANAGITSNGSTRQSANSGGWAKALLRISSGGNVISCYNGVTGSSSAGCGFTVQRSQLGAYGIDFGFSVASRFIVATAIYNGISPSVLEIAFLQNAPNLAIVNSKDALTTIPSDTNFMVVVF